MCDLIGMVQEFITGRAMHINDVSVMDGNSDTISLASDVLVSNPSSHDLPVYSLSYRIMSGGREIISGDIPNPGTIRSNRETAIKIPFTVHYGFVTGILKEMGAAAMKSNPISRVLRSLGVDWDLEYELTATLVVELPIVGEFSITLSKKGTLKLPNFRR